jgi:hypothetical protein
MRIEDPLEILPASVAAWPSAFAAMDDEPRAALGDAVVRAWIDGRLEDRVCSQFADTRAMRAALAEVCEAFGEVEIAQYTRAIDESVARRWCWIRGWYLMEQDEDLFLMGDAFVVPLLEEAAAGCPKRAYAIGIVEHHLRDSAHAALRTGWREARTLVAAYARWLPALRAVDRAAYVERLIEHARPAKVSREEAEQRVRDFWRCHAPNDVVLETAGDGWRVRIGDTRDWIVVERKTGEMRIEQRTWVP